MIELELVRGLHARRVRPLELQQRLCFRFRVQEGADVARVDEAVPCDGAVVVVVAGRRPHRQERPPVLQRTDPEMEKDVTLNVVCIGHQGNFDIVPISHRQTLRQKTNHLLSLTTQTNKMTHHPSQVTASLL